MFKGLFQLKRALAELRRIANSLEIIALHVAKQDNRMWNPKGRVITKADPELMHTDDLELATNEYLEWQRWEAEGNGKERRD